MNVSAMTSLCYSSRNTKSKTPALEAMRRLYAAGFVYQDLFLCGLIRPEQHCSFSGDDWIQEARMLQKEAARLGVVYHQAHLPYYPGNLPFGSQGAAFDTMFWAMMDRSLEICSMLGVRYAVAHPFIVPNAPAEDTAIHVDENLRLYGGCARKARSLGIRLAFENMPMAQTFGSRTCDLLAVVSAFGEETAGICWDTGHGQLIYGEEHAAAIRSLKGKIIALHVHDNCGAKDDHMPPFFGTIPWESLMPALKQADYRGELNFEVAVCWNVPDYLRDEVARLCFRFGEHLVSLFEEKL